MKTKNHKTISLWKQGFTLIEALALLFIFSVVTLTFYEVFRLGTYQINEAKNRLGATALANEKMEIIRNFDYDAIGATSGTPTGNIPSVETVSVNTKTYTVRTNISYIDDPFDGTSAASTDSVANDYKRVGIAVSWGDGGVDQAVALVSFFAPQGIEALVSGGTLAMSALSSQGAAVSGATVRVVNNAISPTLDQSGVTGSDGIVSWPGMKASNQTYQLTVSKSGYYTAYTYPPYPTSSFYPVDVYGSVVDGTYNQKSIILDKVSQLTMRIKTPPGNDSSGTIMPGVQFNLMGGRRIGNTTATPPVAVYDFSQDVTSGADGSYVFADRSPGNYTFTLSDTSRYQLVRLNPIGTTQSEFSLLPDTTPEIVAYVADKQIPSALITVTDQSTGAPVSGVTVSLANTTLGYAAIDSTDAYGQVYFPSTNPTGQASQLTASTTYDISITGATGYSDYTGTIHVNSGLETKSVTLNPL